jgi:hypothetical protein
MIRDYSEMLWIGKDFPAEKKTPTALLISLWGL